MDRYTEQICCCKIKYLCRFLFSVAQCAPDFFFLRLACHTRSKNSRMRIFTHVYVIYRIYVCIFSLNSYLLSKTLFPDVSEESPERQNLELLPSGKYDPYKFLLNISTYMFY